MRIFSRRDAALLLSLLLLFGVLLLVVFLLRGDGSGEWDVVIRYRGETAARLPLETDTEYLFECEEGVNRIVVRDGAVYLGKIEYRDGGLLVAFEAGAKKYGGGILPFSVCSVMKWRSPSLGDSIE